MKSILLGLTLLTAAAAVQDAHAQTNVRLAGMAFLFSYTLASFGPATMGALRDLTDGFTAIWGTLTVLMLAQIGLATLLRPGLRKVD